MPRAPRVDFPGAIHHVGTRGNDSDPIVFDDDDRQHLLHLLARACEHYDLECGAYCLMTTHYHLILRSRSGRLSRGMAMLNGWFARWINAKHERHGHLFGARFFNRILEDPGYRREVARYLALNPVRAGLAAHPDGWTWSSYAGTIGHAPTAAFVSSFIVDEWFERNTAGYRAWVLAGGRSERECLEVLLEAYEPITAVRLAMDTHGIEFAAVAAFLGIKPRTLRERLWTAR